jgi:demethylmenaquinone methyltransferase/2-methoxy-6-polyprenyl-1,4-benzoquinol methylase
MEIKVKKDSVQIDNISKDKKEYVHEIFSTIANKYDFFNDIISLGMHRYWKKFLVKKANLKEGESALDICTGTGDIAFELSKKVGEKGKVVGLDFVQNMLDIANERARKTNNNRVIFIQGDAMDLPFEDNTFDVVTVSYGLRNIPDIPKAVSEMIRVSKKGGKIISLDLGKPQIPIYKDIYYFYFYKIMPFITSLFQGNKSAYKYLPNSLEEFPAQKGLIKIMKDLGLKDVKCYNFLGGVSSLHIGIK